MKSLDMPGLYAQMKKEISGKGYEVRCIKKDDEIQYIAWRPAEDGLWYLIGSDHLVPATDVYTIGTLDRIVFPPYEPSVGICIVFETFEVSTLTAFEEIMKKDREFGGIPSESEYKLLFSEWLALNGFILEDAGG